MKFCKNLQRVATITDPAWAPFIFNYKQLKKVVKALPTSDEEASLLPIEPDQTPTFVPSLSVLYEQERRAPASLNDGILPLKKRRWHRRSCLGQNPAEIVFFSLLLQEFNKATQFYEKVEQECLIREEVITDGMKILQRQGQPLSMLKTQWCYMARSIFRLRCDLVLFETFSIMTFFAFSKILKKHDKLTRYHTRSAFMERVVNRSNFAYYPRLLRMIANCERLYERAFEEIQLHSRIQDDERLFLQAVNQWRPINIHPDTRGSEDARAQQPQRSKRKITAENVHVAYCRVIADQQSSSGRDSQSPDVASHNLSFRKRQRQGRK